MHKPGRPAQDAPPPRRGRIAAAGSDAGALGAAAFAAKGFADPVLVLEWPKIVGAETARIAIPLRLSGNILTLKTEPGAAAFLQLETRNLCARINTYLGRPRIEKLKFVQAPLMRPPPRPPRPQLPSDLPSDDPAHRFRGVGALHEALLKLARARRSRLILP